MLAKKKKKEAITEFYVFTNRVETLKKSLKNIKIKLF